jgi:peptidoglycan/LPS O-acetylase OafA/YrhL
VAPAARPPHQKRADIQALRAFAVLAVVVYHLWPSRLRGGFVGVDVFFVISGYLMADMLIRAEPRQAVDLLRFWSRRVLRLLPAATLVTVTVVVTAWIVMPSSEWARVASDATAGLLYVENWHLIGQSTNYLAQHQAPSPFQHYWSLSVEEQYYIAFPFLVLAATVIGRRFGRRQVAYAVSIGLLLAASLAVCISMTATNEPTAYLSTLTRAWELAAGGLLAVRPDIVRATGARTVILWCGILGLAGSVSLIGEGSSFPGWIALLPVTSTVLVLAAADPQSRLNPQRLWSARPVQALGDWSYAVYLWHWPLIILTPYVLKHPLTTKDRLAIVALTLVLSAVSTRLIENPLRRTPRLRGRLRATFALGIALTITGVGAAALLTNRADAVAASSKRSVAQYLHDPCFGAGSLVAGRHCKPLPLITSPAFTKNDVSLGIVPGACLNWPPFKTPLTVCKYGDGITPTKRIAILGNSQMGQWIPALDAIGKRDHILVETHLLGVCATTLTLVPFGHSLPTNPKQCQRLMHRIVAGLRASKPDLIIVSSLDATASAHVIPEDGAATYAPLVRALAAIGRPVVVLHSTPARLNVTPPVDCVGEHFGDVQACDGKATDWIVDDPLYAAAESGGPNVHPVNMNDVICSPATCPAVIGGVIVMHDNDHLSATYVTTLSPFLESRIVPFIH